jgi:hypothetical protein
MKRKYHTELRAAAAYYRSRAANLSATDPANLSTATQNERSAYQLRVRASELELHVRTCPASYHLVQR